ncbi:MAG: mannose-1-phosphate guanylyltransferase/mannose-6-phosphate isomerase [Hyphomicrobiaceae bacterium]
MAIHPVILSGGSGTRLWPRSRAMYPKQFIDLFGQDGSNLLGDALKRLPAPEFDPVVVLSNNDHRFLISEALEATGTAAAEIILEPMARNTAPAVAVAAIHAVARDPLAVLAVMPSDHLIAREDTFRHAVRAAANIAGRGHLVLFGITPSSPHTGYGYIRTGAPFETGRPEAFHVAQFTEKPNAETAASYLASGDFVWNSGIFVLHARTLLDELSRYAPAVVEAAEQAYRKASRDGAFLRLDRAAFQECPDISIDYAVMERTERSVVMPIDIGWSDVGSWASLLEVSKTDASGNSINGDAMLVDTEGTYVHSDRGLVATLGVKDLVIVNTPDALLVADKSRSQDVGTIVGKLRQSGRREYEQHVRNLRPWGYFETLSIGNRFQVKKLHVRPGGKLSMQMHHHRSEHWIVVQGTAKVTIGDIERLVRENESVYIFATQWHRLENPGKVPLELVEVQIGTYLGEDDIVRSDDIYNRAPDETK